MGLAASSVLYTSLGDPIDKKLSERSARNSLVVEMVQTKGALDNEEFNYFGVHGNTDKSVDIRMSSTGSVAGEPPLYFGTPGATGVWAPENTREAIVDPSQHAMYYVWVIGIPTPYCGGSTLVLHLQRQCYFELEVVCCQTN